jgi:hypothetical protein
MGCFSYGRIQNIKPKQEKRKMKTQIKTTLIRTLALSAMLACSAVYAQEVPTQALAKARHNTLGVRYSNLTGYGVSYQRNLFSEYYLRTTAWFKYYEFIRGHESDLTYRMKTDNTYNFGLDIQRNIIHENKYRVFGFIGGGYAVREKGGQYNADGVIVKDNGAREQELITAGLGGGIEFFFSQSVSADMGVSYKFDYDYNANEQALTKETGLGTMVGLNLNF